MNDDHLCPRTDGESWMCFDGCVYGPCESEYCYGACEAWWACECDCHLDE